MPQNFYLTPGSSSDAFYLQPSNMNAVAGAPLQLWYGVVQWFAQSGQGVTANPAQLWQVRWTYPNPAQPDVRSPYVSFVSSADPTLALTLSSTGALELQPYDTANTTQQWTCSPGGVEGKPQLCTLGQGGQWLQAGEIWSGAVPTMATPPAGPVPDSMLWAFDPYAPATQQAMDLVWWPSVGTPSSQALVATVQPGALEPGLPVILSPGAGGGHAMIWRYTVEGFLESALNSHLVLSIDTNDNVVVYPKQKTDTAFQQWAVMVIDARQMTFALVNQQTNRALVGAASGSALTTQPWTNAPEQVWSTSVVYPLETLLSQPPLPFPGPQNAAQATAYDYISANTNPSYVANGGIRYAYTQLNVDLSNYVSQISSMTAAEAGVDENDWNLTTTQILEEIGYANNVKLFFSNLKTFHSTFSGLSASTVGALVSEFGISTSDGTSGVLQSVFEGMLYTALSAAPGGAPLVANVIQSGINAVAASSSAAQSGSLGNFAASVGELESTLTQASLNVIGALGQFEQLALSDWGKMQGLERLITLPPTDRWSLAITPEMAETVANAALPGFQVEVLKFLLPARFRIYQYLQMYTGIPNISPPPSQFTWQESFGVPGVWNTYVLGDGDHYPSSSAFTQYVTGNGVLPFNLYRCSDGWNFKTTLSQVVAVEWGGDGPSNYCLTTVANSTPFPLTLAISPYHDDPFSWKTPTTEAYSVTVPPFNAAQFALCHNHEGLSAGVKLSWAGTSQNPVINVEVHQDLAVASAGNVWVSSAGSNQAGFTSQSKCVAGSVHQGLPGTIEIEVQYTGNAYSQAPRPAGMKDFLQATIQARD